MSVSVAPWMPGPAQSHGTVESTSPCVQWSVPSPPVDSALAVSINAILSDASAAERSVLGAIPFAKPSTRRSNNPTVPASSVKPQSISKGLSWCWQGPGPERPAS